MPCTTYGTMCEHCQFQFLKVFERGYDPSTLEYNPYTYPIVFRCIFEYPAGRGSVAAAHEHMESILSTLKDRLQRRFNQPVPAWSSCEVYEGIPAENWTGAETETETGMLVRVSFLVDFPCEFVGGEDADDPKFRAFLRAVTSLSRALEDWSCRIEVDDGLKEFLFGGLRKGVGVDCWDAFICSMQDHLCAARLSWFLRRVGLFTFI